MDRNTNYFIQKNKKTSEVILIDYDQKDGYQINPKVKKKDEINVNKIVFMSPNLSEKLIRKKIDKRIEYLLNQLKIVDEDNDSGFIERTLMDAEKLRIMIINNYVKHLGNTYQSLTLKKIQIIINELKIKLYNSQAKKIPSFFMNFEPKEMGGMEYEEEKRGRGR